MPFRVYITTIGCYSVDAIQSAVSAGLKAIDVSLTGHLFAKANWVLAHHRVARYAYTRPELLDGALHAIFALNPNIRDLVLGGNSGLGVSTRRMAKRAGVQALLSKFPNRLFIEPGDEALTAIYRFSHQSTIDPADPSIDERHLAASIGFWKTVKTSALLSRCDGMVLFPKLKSNVLSDGFSGAIKLVGIGLLTDQDRLHGHSQVNNLRMSDMLTLAAPDLIVSDGIEIGWGGNQMTQGASKLGLILIANNAVAHDLVATKLLGLETVDHVAIAGKRGLGPTSLDEIEILGCSLAELTAHRPKSPSGLIPVDRFAERFEHETGQLFPLEILAGTPYDAAGNHGIFLDWLYLSFDHLSTRRQMARWPNVSVTIGSDWPDPLYPTLFLVGDRAIATFESRFKQLSRQRLPHWLWKQLRGIRTRYRYLHPSGTIGTAYAIPGNPPSHRDLIAGFALGSRFKMRVSLFRWDLLLETYGWNLVAQLRSWKNNRYGQQTFEVMTIPRIAAKQPVATLVQP